MAQQRGLVSVWLRPPTAALAWCAVPSPSACRPGPSGARHSSGSPPLGEGLGSPGLQQSACGCKAFLQEGACGHCDAAVQAAVQMAAAASEGDRPADLGSRVIAKGLAALPSQECFSGLAAKSREISCLSGLLNRGGSSPGAPATTSTALAVPAPAAATAAQGPRRNKTPRAEPSSRAVHEAAYLAGGSYIAAGLSVLAKTRSQDKVFLRTYSFDAPPVLEALEAACARGAACSLVADASQCAKTKLHDGSR